MDKAKRDEKGRFIKGTPSTKGMKLPYSPRPTAHKNFSKIMKSLATQILEGIGIEEIIIRIKNLPDVPFSQVICKLEEIKMNQDNNAFKASLEELKMSRENNNVNNTKTIEIGFTEIDDSDDDSDGDDDSDDDNGE